MALLIPNESSRTPTMSMVIVFQVKYVQRKLQQSGARGVGNDCHTREAGRQRATPSTVRGVISLEEGLDVIKAFAIFVGRGHSFEV